MGTWASAPDGGGFAIEVCFWVSIGLMSLLLFLGFWLDDR